MFVILESREYLCTKFQRSIMLTNIDNIVFDLGGVILDIDRNRCVNALKEVGIPNSESLLGLYRQEGIFLDIEEGRISAAEFYDSLRKIATRPVSCSDIEKAFGTFITGLPLSRLKALRELRKTKKIFALSNTNTVMYETIIDRLFRAEGLTMADYFDGQILSFREHHCKPQKDIFTALLQRYDLAGSRTLFLDDSEENCEAARNAGLLAIHITPDTEFTEVLNNNNPYNA